MAPQVCFGCEHEIVGTPAAGMNLPGVTPGPIYWCESCKPPATEEETGQMIANFIDPPREPAR